jgi:uncharacterized damage-inducible protein DinB
MIELCRSLTDEQLDATAVGTFGSIRSTLQHVVGAEGGYAFRLGGLPVRPLKGDDPWPGFDRLTEIVRQTTAAFIAAAGSVTDTPIRVGSDDEPYDVEPAVILVQAFNHSTEHRSQICTILTELGIAAPELSGWEWGAAADRMRPA